MQNGFEKKEKFRDPVHGFIEVNSFELEIINSKPFQRLRNIRQLALTNLVFHGAVHTRFSHSLGVVHLVTRAFNSSIQKGRVKIKDEKKDWYEQILRIIGLTHDLGHAPFSHASESAFVEERTHEDYTKEIILKTEVGRIIEKIGNEFVVKYGSGYNITPQLICNIYIESSELGENSEFAFLRTFMDSELDCDKMDYLLRDSLYCGVNYGNYDVDRLIASLCALEENGTMKLAIEYGGVQAFEAFVLARYFMFVQVYFHRTRRFFDITLGRALNFVLDNGVFPEDVHEYLNWDDCKLIELLKNSKENEYCKLIIDRMPYSCIEETKTHSLDGDRRYYRLLVANLFEKFESKYFIQDDSSEKMASKIPKEEAPEKQIKIIHKRTNRITTINQESFIISKLTQAINIKRIYIRPEKKVEVEKYLDRVRHEVDKND